MFVLRAQSNARKKIILLSKLLCYIVIKKLPKIFDCGVWEISKLLFLERLMDLRILVFN